MKTKTNHNVNKNSTEINTIPTMKLVTEETGRLKRLRGNLKILGKFYQKNQIL